MFGTGVAAWIEAHDLLKGLLSNFCLIHPEATVDDDFLLWAFASTAHALMIELSAAGCVGARGNPYDFQRVARIDSLVDGGCVTRIDAEHQAETKNDAASGRDLHCGHFTVVSWITKPSIEQ